MSICSKTGCHAVLAPLSGCYPPLEGRSPTCYSPVRHSVTPCGATAFDLHVLGTPPALLLLLSEYPRARESKPPAPCWLILDGLSDVASQLAPLGFIETVLARPIQFSKNRPGPEGPRPLVH